MSDPRRWHIQRSDGVLETPYFRLRRDEVRLPGGRIVPDYYVMENSAIVVIFAVTTDDHLLLVEQYKHGWGDVLLELPAGMADSDDPLQAARRELLEETGHSAAHWELLGRFIPSPTRSTSEVFLYMAQGAAATAPQHLDANEQITVRRVPLGQVRAALNAGDVRVLDSVLAMERGLARLGL